jgi:2-dehydropantoate 2-reductase
VTDSPDAVAGADVVFCALKAYSLPEIAPRLGPLLAPRAAVIWAQNGIPWWYDAPGGPLESVDPGGAIAAAIPRAHSIGCVVYSSTEIIEPGVIRHVEGTRFSIGELDGSVSERCEAISAAFAGGGLKAPTDANLRDQIWLKLIGNAAFNPVTALTRATLGQLATSEQVVELLRAVFGEVAEVAGKLGVSFPVTLERRLQAGLAVGDHRTSMLQDLLAGKRLELDCMTGAVIELADRLGVAVPHLRTIHACASLLDQLNRAPTQ